MPIIGTLPNTISNGQAVDATPVMADFNFIVNQVNANASPLGTLTAPSGTRMLFQQSTAPLGWVTDATLTDHTLQIATTGIIFSAGNGYSSMFNAQWTSDGHALTTAELAVHSHSTTENPHTHTSPSHNHGTASGFNFWTATNTGGGASNFTGGANSINQEVTTGSTAVTINSATTGLTVNNAGSGTAHTHTKTFNANFAQALVAVKS